MKRKISFGITLLLMLSLLLLALTACEEKKCEHSYQSSVTKAATCESDGVMTYTCSLCTDSYTDVIGALGHDEVSHDAKAPTCTEIGWDAYVTCSRCDYTTCVEKAALTHNEVTDEAVAPTCTKTGLTEGLHCSVCNTVFVEQKTVDKLDHNYSEELIFNSTHHYYECKCGSRKDEEKHISPGAPTATHDKVCTKCGYVINEAIGISFKTLTVDGNNVFGKVSNDTTYYSFINEINAVGGAKYIVSRNTTGTDWLPAKTIDLAIGNNTIYIIEMIDDEPSAIYTVIIRRRPVYTVTFDANGGTAVETQYVEEEELAATPETTYAGYTFTGWDYDFGTPIMSDTHITASWKANDDTKYTVEYYLENLDKTDYELIDTNELTGTTDTTAEALIKEFEHFTFNTEKSITSGNIDRNGILVLKVYYTRNVYKLSNANTDLGSISKSGSYVYGSIEAFEVTATTSKLGYEFIGWYSKGVLVSTAQTYIFTSENNVEARFALRQEMANFNFVSTSSTCQITGIKDKTITEIIVPDYVTSISGGVFFGCSNLESLTIPFVGGNKSSKSASSSTLFGYIFGTSSYRGAVATRQCYSSSSSSYAIYYIPSSLKSVTVTGGNILYGAFYNCDRLTSVIIGNSVTSIGDYAFHYCDSLTSVTIPDSVTSIGDYAFYNCISLTSVTIPGSVTSIGNWAFTDCTSLTSITVSEENTAYKSIGGNLYSEDGKTLIQYAIRKTDTSFVIPDGVTSIGFAAFYECKSLTSVTIPDSVTSIGDLAFRGCTSLTSVTIGNSVTSIGFDAFYGCTGLTSVTIPDSVTTIGFYAFYYCTSLTNVTIGNSVTSIDYYAFYNCTSLTSINIPDSVTLIGYRAFTYCDSLTSVTIPDSVTSIGDQAFYGCTNLTIYCEASSEPSGWNFDWNSSNCPVAWGYINKGVTNDGFEWVNTVNGIVIEKYSGSTTEVVIPDTINGVSVIAILDRAFAYCDRLTSVTIPNSVTSIGDSAFYGCSSLTSVIIPDSVTSIGDDAFETCTSLVSITIPDSVTSIGSDAFRNCTSLASVIIPNSVTSIGNSAFSHCSSLTSIIIPDSVTNIGDSAFSYCGRLTSVTIPDSVTSIGDSAFENCTILTSVIIPNSVTSIGGDAFENCTSLTIYCEAASKPSGWDSYWNYSKRPVTWGYKG